MAEDFGRPGPPRGPGPKDGARAQPALGAQTGARVWTDRRIRSSWEEEVPLSKCRVKTPGEHRYRGPGPPSAPRCEPVRGPGGRPCGRGCPPTSAPGSRPRRGSPAGVSSPPPAACPLPSLCPGPLPLRPWSASLRTPLPRAHFGGSHRRDGVVGTPDGDLSSGWGSLSSSQPPGLLRGASTPGDPEQRSQVRPTTLQVTRIFQDPPAPFAALRSGVWFGKVLRGQAAPSPPPWPRPGHSQ